MTCLQVSPLCEVAPGWVHGLCWWSVKGKPSQRQAQVEIDFPVAWGYV